MHSMLVSIILLWEIEQKYVGRAEKQFFISPVKFEKCSILRLKKPGAGGLTDWIIKCDMAPTKNGVLYHLSKILDVLNHLDFWRWHNAWLGGITDSRLSNRFQPCPLRSVVCVLNVGGIRDWGGCYKRFWISFTLQPPLWSHL